MSLKNNARLSVERLDDRTLPAVLNLAGAATEVAADGFIARRVDGADVADFTRFVRLQGFGTEEGYNTTARRTQFDEIRGPNIQSALTLGEVPVVVVNGVAYREFVLNVNQNRFASRLALDEVQVFLGDTANRTGYRSARGGTLGGERPVFDLDARQNNTIVLNDRANGAGFGDMVLLIPDAAFAGAGDDAFVTLYSRFTRSNGGSETWAVRQFVAEPPPPPPPANTAVLSGYVFVENQGGNGIKDAGEQGLGGIRVFLYGEDAQGNTIQAETVTDENGFYSFTGLAPAVYTLSVSGPELPTDVNGTEVRDGQDFVGSLGGTAGADLDNLLSGINVDAGAQGVNYNFTMYPYGSGS
jgi:hypothetical protein